MRLGSWKEVAPPEPAPPGPGASAGGAQPSWHTGPVLCFMLMFRGAFNDWVEGAACTHPQNKKRAAEMRSVRWRRDCPPGTPPAFHNFLQFGSLCFSQLKRPLGLGCCQVTGEDSGWTKRNRIKGSLILNWGAGETGSPLTL